MLKNLTIVLAQLCAGRSATRWRRSQSELSVV